MVEPTIAPPLFIYHENQLVGTLTYSIRKNDFDFSFNPEWISGKYFPLSPHITKDGAIKPGVVTRFLENLLPEGKALKDLAQTLKVTTTNIYALVEAIGREATGAFRISASEESEITDFRITPREELIGRIRERASQPLAIWDGQPRLSLAGVQEKLAIVIKDNEYGFGKGRIASTHILKFGNIKINHLVLNEFFCMKLAESIGLPVARCELINLSERVLQVERFDRTWESENHVKRHHIVDGCQVLDLSPEHKYERLFGDTPAVAHLVGPANLKNLYNFCQSCSVPAKAQLQLLQWVFFNLIIGNCDHHVKNISYFITTKGIKIAPFYDLVNITVYPQFEQALAFEIGDTFNLKEVNGYHFFEMAKTLQLAPRFISTHLKKFCEKICSQIESFNPFSDLNHEEALFIENMKLDIRTRAEKFLIDSATITNFR